ncbi:hypothetical protein MASR2M18_19190 [Ignavibacteria bacterium]|nr:hypothetical protein [Bacteroidota bacterium]MCZ2133117.1 hypothetical protein [Bacteroidota bacterium]
MNMFHGIAAFIYVLSAVAYAMQARAETADSAATRRAAEMHRRWMEAAHPTPKFESEREPTPAEKFHSTVAIVPLAEQIGGAPFLDTNMIEPETDQMPVQNESSIAINPLNSKNLIASAVDYRGQSSTWVYVSDDGGKSWRNINLGKPFTGWTSSNDPSVAFADDGTGYLMYGGFGNRNLSNPENGVFLARTNDGGKTWKAHIPVILHRGVQTADSNFEDKYYVHVDNSPQSPYFGRVYTPWKRVVARDSSTQIVATYSTDKGDTWSIPVQVSARLPRSSEDTTFGQSFPLIRTGPNGDVYCFWNFGPQRGIGFSKSNDGGASWSTPRIIHKYNSIGTAKQIAEGVRHILKGAVRVESYPTIICDLTNGPRRGGLYMAWAADSVPNIYFSRSADGGNTWTTPKIIHETQKNDQFWPWIALDPTNGDIAAMYLDSRDDENNIGVNCYVSYSSDGGDTWRDFRASDAYSDLRRNPFAGNNFAGDYSGCDFYGGIIYPSWVDMRNTVTNIADNDAYTAIVNLRIPRPDEPFTAQTLPAAPTEISLSWTPPKERVLGQPLNVSEFSHILYRDGVQTAELPGATDSYRDSGLEPYRKYSYKIIVAAGADSSAPRESYAFAGGSRLPDKPALIAGKGTDNREVRLTARVPSLRSDSITPFVNPKSIIIYRDGAKISESPITVDDTGKTIVVTDTPPERGWYRYAISVSDAATPSNESAITPRLLLYTGPANSVFRENFDGAPSRYLTSASWAVTSSFGHSGNSSLTNSFEKAYSNNERDTFVIFPVLTSSPRELRFFHAAIIHQSDSGFAEYSSDYGKSWKRFAAFNNSMFAPWADGTLNGADWREEKFTLPATADTALLRFRFAANFRNTDVGWFIDDITIDAPTSAEMREKQEQITLYPNPAQSYIVMRLPFNSAVDIIITDAIGERIELPPDAIRQNGSHITFDVSTLSNGVYTLQSILPDGSRFARPFVIWR